MLKKSFKAAAVIGLAVLCLLGSGCTAKTGEKYLPPAIIADTVTYKTVEVTKGTLLRKIDDYANVSVRSVDGTNKVVLVYSGLSKNDLKKGDKVKVEIRGNTAAATVIKENGVETGESFGQYEVHLDIDSEYQSLFIYHMNQNVRIYGQFDEKSDIIVLPSAYVLRRDFGDYVLVLEKDAATGIDVKKKVKVTIGMATKDGYEITDGLKVGDRVIID